MNILCALESHVQKKRQKFTCNNVKRFYSSKISKQTALSQLASPKTVKKSIISAKYNEKQNSTFLAIGI